MDILGFVCYNSNVCQSLSDQKGSVQNMPEVRKDKKGRRLKDGESQRKDGRYQFRYTDVDGERKCLYDLSLESLREKEKEVAVKLSQGVSYFGEKTLFSEFAEKLFALKRTWKESTRITMERNLNIIKKASLYTAPISKIKMTDCKEYLISLHDDGYSYSIIETVFLIMKETFELACDDDALLKNPCRFKLRNIISNNKKKVTALSPEQEKSLFTFLENDTYGHRQLDIFTVLIGTGLRISEFAALTIQDVDFERNILHVNKQTLRVTGAVKITELKTDAGYRDIPLTADVKQALENLLEKRNGIKKDVMIDGYVGFLSVTRNGRPRTHAEYADAFRNIMKRYNEKSDVTIERCTPHTLRHTFCTKCIASGADIKTVQYLMGHSDAGTTLNTYADAVEQIVADSMKSIEIHRYGT